MINDHTPKQAQICDDIIDTFSFKRLQKHNILYLKVLNIISQLLVDQIVTPTNLIMNKESIWSN